MATKKKIVRGRPSRGISEARVEVPMPAEMRDLARACAAREGVTLAEFVRRAVRVRLGEAVTT